MLELGVDQNIVLIGMPGVGKSTVGVLLAKSLSRDFVDVDLLIQRAQGLSLQDLLESEGLEAFCIIEEEQVLSLALKKAVIATGGSVVYSRRAMERLKANGCIVYLQLPLSELLDRITNMESRGIAILKRQSFEDLYAERTPLYDEFADATVDCSGLSHEGVLSSILSFLD